MVGCSRPLGGTQITAQSETAASGSIISWCDAPHRSPSTVKPPTTSLVTPQLFFYTVAAWSASRRLEQFTICTLSPLHALLLAVVPTLVIPHGKVYVALCTPHHVSHADEVRYIGRYGVVLDAGSSVSTFATSKWVLQGCN